jgi:hypothetical protein
MENKYGPQTSQVAALLEQMQSLTDSQESALSEAFSTETYYTSYLGAYEACDAVWHIWSEPLDVDTCAAISAHLDELEYDWDDAFAAGQGVYFMVLALVIRDVIGNIFTQEHYDLLTSPWRIVIGPIHSDDADI